MDDWNGWVTVIGGVRHTFDKVVGWVPDPYSQCVPGDFTKNRPPPWADRLAINAASAARVPARGPVDGLEFVAGKLKASMARAKELKEDANKAEEISRTIFWEGDLVPPLDIPAPALPTIEQLLDMALRSKSRRLSAQAVDAYTARGDALGLGIAPVVPPRELPRLRTLRVHQNVGVGSAYREEE